MDSLIRMLLSTPRRRKWVPVRISFGLLLWRERRAVSIAIHDVWPPYPTVNLQWTTGSLTRLSLLQLYIGGEHERILAFGTRSTPSLATSPAAAPSPPPPLPPTPARAPAAPKTPPSRFAAPEPPHIAARHAAATSYPPSASYTSGFVRVAAQYYTPDRKYGGLDKESLPRACAAFASVCEAFSVPPSLRVVCLPFALRLTENNLPALFQDNRGLPEMSSTPAYTPPCTPSVSVSTGNPPLTALSPPSPSTLPSPASIA